MHLEVLPGKNDIHALLVEPIIPFMNQNCVNGESNHKGAGFKRMCSEDASNGNVPVEEERMVSPAKRISR